MRKPSSMPLVSSDDCSMIPTPDQLIADHLDHLRAGDLSPNTIDDAGKVLRAADRWLSEVGSPRGLLTAATEELTAWLARDGWSTQTRATYRQHLRRFYQWAVTVGHLDWDPSSTLRRPRVPIGVPRPCTDAQARAATTLLPMPYLLATRLAAYQGLRCIEIARLHKAHVEPDGTRVWGKGNHYDVIPTHHRVWEIVKDLPDGPLVTRRRGWPVDDQWMTKMGARVLRAHDLDITMHQLRHWFATTLLRATGNMEKVRRLMRHRSIVSTQVYTLVELDELRDAVESLPDLSGP